MDKIRALRLDKKHHRLLHDGQWRLQDVYPDAATRRSAAPRAPCARAAAAFPRVAWMPGKIKAE